MTTTLRRLVPLLLVALVSAGCRQTHDSSAPRVAAAIERARAVPADRINRAGGEEAPATKSAYELGELIRLALDRNESLIQSSLAVGIAEATSSATHASMFAPTLSASASNRRSARPPAITSTFGAFAQDRDITRWNAAITWAPFHAGNLLYRYESTRLGEERTRLEMHRVEQQIVFTVVQLYFQRLALEGQLEVTNGFIRSLESEEDRVKKLVAAESAIENDVMKISLELTRQRQARVETENRIDIVVRRLNQVLVLPHDATYALKWDAPFAERALPNATELIAAALDARPDLRAQEVALHALGLDRKGELAGALPSFATQIGFDHSDSGKGNTDDAYFLLSLNWDLFDLSRGHRATAIHRQALAAHSRLRDSQRSVGVEVEEALREIENQASAFRLGQFAVKQATENLRVQRALYDNERSTANDLLEAEVELTDARNIVIQATYAYQIALAQLEAALGEQGRFGVGLPKVMEKPVDEDE